MKDKKIQNLLNKEEWLVLNIQNASYQVKNYLAELKSILEKYELSELEGKTRYYTEIFEYYKDDLIPAIHETAEMELRHMEIFARNPDNGFNPVIEVQNHQELTLQFLGRFEQIHREFQQFTTELKKKISS